MAAALMGCGRQQVNQTQSLTAGHEWQFKTGDSLVWAEPSYDDSGWTTITTAQTWEEQGFTGYDGFGWYRQRFAIPEGFDKTIRENGGLVISFANADDADELYFNGTLVGATGKLPPEYISGYGIKRRYVVPPERVKTGETNLIALRVFDGGGGGGIVTEQVNIFPLSEVHQLPLSVRIHEEDWVFRGQPEASVGIAVAGLPGKNCKVTILLNLSTDDYQPVGEYTDNVKVIKGDTAVARFKITLPAPGFYRCSASAVKEGIKGEAILFNIGYEPEKIVSPPDAMPDFDEFWKNTRAELDKVPPQFRMERMQERSEGARNLYHVKMQSFGNVTIEGYYAAPKATGKYPVIIGYMGYGSEPWMPGSDDNPDVAEFILSVRGQGIQKAGNPYGKWIVHGLESKETYYYRGAFMDLVRAIDFVASRPEVDAEKIVAEGGSQGGAFTLAACALDDRIRAAAPTIPFLSDYPHYFRIAPWPASDFREYLQANPDRTWDEIYRILSYFDIKNLAPRITCPVLMAAGLQDDVCPPHTNFAAYNLIPGEKKYYIFPDQGHNVPARWYQLRMQFFREKLESGQER